jgi:hypothetical protein
MIKISFGVNNSVDKDVSKYPSVNQVLGDLNLQQFLGYGNNVEARINGVTAVDGQRLVAGDVVELVTKANKKG